MIAAGPAIEREQLMLQFMPWNAHVASEWKPESRPQLWLAGALGPVLELTQGPQPCAVRCGWGSDGLTDGQAQVSKG